MFSKHPMSGLGEVHKTRISSIYWRNIIFLEPGRVLDCQYLYQLIREHQLGILFYFVIGLFEYTDTDYMNHMRRLLSLIMVLIIPAQTNLWGFPIGAQNPSHLITEFFQNNKTDFPPGWVSYTNGNIDIIDLDYDPRGYLWAASQGGVVRWNLQDNSYIKFTTIDGLPSNEIKSILVAKDGTVWVIADYTIVRFIHDKWKVYPTPVGMQDPNHIFQDSKERVWITGYGAAVFSGGGWKTYNMQDGLGSNTIGGFAEDSQHNIWLGTWFMYCGCEATPDYIEGVSRFDGKKWDVFGESIGMGDSVITNGSIQVTTMAADTQGGIWFGTGDYFYYFDGKKTTHVTDLDGIPNNNVYNVKVAEDGTLWMVTYSGAASYRDGLVTTIPSITKYHIYTVETGPDGIVWLGTEYGIVRWDGSNATELLIDEKIPTQNIYHVDTTEDGLVWIGTDMGLISTDGSTWKFYNHKNGLPGDYVTLIKTGPDGSVWAAFGNRLAFMENDIWKMEPYTTSGPIKDIYIKSHEEVWIMADSIYSIDGDKFQQYRSGVINPLDMIYSPQTGFWFLYSALSNYTNSKWTYYSLGDGRYQFRSITLAPDGKIWLALDSSDPSASYSSYFRSFDGTDWMTEETTEAEEINDIVFDQRGSLWVAAKNGVYKYDGKNWIHFTVKNGLASNQVEKIEIAADGSIWFLTDSGLTRYDNP
jgi:ligand-binding sensor domain-containing protein